MGPRNIKRHPNTHSEWTCERCGKPIAQSSKVMLELDQRISEYHDFGVPEEHSQGWFDFGPDCAKVLRKRARQALLEYVL